MQSSLVIGLRMIGEKYASEERDYEKEYRTYHARPEQIKRRAARNAARRLMGLEKGDPREVDHHVPLSNGGSNRRDNLHVMSRAANRAKHDDEG